MLGEQLNRMVTPLAQSQGVSHVQDDPGHALLVVLVAVMTLIALMVVLTYIEPRKPHPVAQHEHPKSVVKLSSHSTTN